jgi:hypothetical protein
MTVVRSQSIIKQSQDINRVLDGRDRASRVAVHQLIKHTFPRDRVRSGAQVA